jgi:hypothetical protein
MKATDAACVCGFFVASYETEKFSSAIETTDKSSLWFFYSLKGLEMEFAIGLVGAIVIGVVAVVIRSQRANAKPKHKRQNDDGFVI